MDQTAVVEKSEKGQPPTSRKQPTNKKIPLAIAGGVVFVVFAVIVWSLAIYNNIYSGVSVLGINLGGLSQQKAEEILSAESDKIYTNASFTLTVDGQQQIFDAQQLGISLPVEKLATLAHNQGRKGSLGERLSFVLTSPFNKTELNIEQDIAIDKELLTSLLQDLAQRTDIEPKDYSSQAKADAIVISIGHEGKKLPIDALSAVIYQKLLTPDFTPLSYESETIPCAEINWDTLYNSVYVAPQNAVLNPTDKGSLIMPHTVGISFDVEAAKAMMLPGTESINVPIIYTDPEITQKMLEAKLFQDVLGDYSSNITNSSANRIGNIRTAASYINTLILLPGETFSYNGTVGERTSARGFKLAGAYLNGKVVDELGGGICQLSSTMYNTVLLANLEIVERTNHSMLVGYVPSGQDATVNWGTKDFRFSNNTGYPLQIFASVEGGKANVKIMGTKTDDTTVSMERNVLGTTAFKTVKNVNPALEVGASKKIQDGHTGTSVETYRVVKDADGNVISRTFEAKSTYAKTDAIYEIGPEAVTPSVTPTPDPITPTPDPITPTPDPITPTPDPVEPTPDPAGGWTTDGSEVTSDI